MLLVVLASGISSCSKSFLEKESIFIEPDLNNGPPLLSENNYTQGREVKFVIEGDYSGKIDMIPFLHNSMPIVPIKKINSPWEQTFKVPDTSSIIGGYAQGFYGDGNDGEIASLKMYYHNRLLYSVTRKTNADGINLPLETYRFQDAIDFDSKHPISTSNIGKKVTYIVESDYLSTDNKLVYRLADGGYEDIQLENVSFEYSFVTNKNSISAVLYPYIDFQEAKIGDKMVLILLIGDEIVKTSTFAKTGPETGNNSDTETFYYFFD